VEIGNLEDFLKAKAKIEKEGSLKVRVATGSMEPWLQVGDFFELKYKKDDSLKTADIVAYWYKNQIFLHFFWRYSFMKSNIGKKTFVTRSLKEIEHDEGPHPMGNYLGILDFKASFTQKLYFYFRLFRRSLLSQKK